ncbi:MULTISPECIES: response regulator transcription factor [Vibrio]|uniref:response regulator transcription factor n=1 Tax=Vibrio TaxID=662 RepID=UPI001CDB8530|nr:MULTISPECIES: response regulator transcription factor [Vibrio]ELA6646977.1 response regulator transcription factor [Vibrio alginolyticus]MCA2449270.1 response regulator transcription factor [Vibrio alginolyticus]MCA2473140.1 response regulator transcription factor [Vibrio alginolyticus]MDW1794952.1 response regulator transcription factor [Vibrio sp. Vb2297]MDW1962630.1 response regulator transcription factor [Vibrio sp. Vb0587]
MVGNTILLVEDDSEIARLTKMYLEAEGYTVTVIDNGQNALETIKGLKPDLVLLDLMLPGKNGAEICQEVRKFYHGIIIVLTASDDEMSEVSLFKFGADDYLTKPIKGNILLARIEAALRRYCRQVDIVEEEKLSRYGISLCLRRSQAFYLQKDIGLTSSEFEILELLMLNVDKPVSRESCCRLARGIEYCITDRSIDMRISSLRKKFSKAHIHTATIKTIRHHGYMLTGK